MTVPVFDVMFAPPDVDMMLLPGWEARSTMHARLVLVHTNGAENEGSIQSAYNWAKVAGQTKPHYQVDRDGSAAKFLPSDRQGSAQYKANPFCIGIETADLGWPTTNRPDAPGGTIGFTPAQAETIARIIAYESIVCGFDLGTPDAWDGSGCGGHTDPFGYPYWTNVQGKPCPGPAKKAELRGSVFPRAREIRAGWLNQTPTPEPPPLEEDPVRYLHVLTAGRPDLLVAFDGAGVSVVGISSPADEQALVVGLDAIRCNVSVEQYGEILARAAG